MRATRRSARSTSAASAPTSTSSWSRRSRPRCWPSSPTPSDVAAALDSYNPPQPEFKALKEKLAELRKGALAPKAEEEKKPDLVRVGEGKTLHVGMKDARVIALRKRLDIAGDKDNPLYDDAVRDAVKTFQTASRHRRRRQCSAPTRCARSTARSRGAAPDRRSDRYHHRQHGALALAAARSRQSARDRQRAGLHA